jgi:hypothetical protein
MELAIIDRLILSLTFLSLGIVFMHVAASFGQKKKETGMEVMFWIASVILIVSGIVVGWS